MPAFGRAHMEYIEVLGHVKDTRNKSPLPGLDHLGRLVV